MQNISRYLDTFLNTGSLDVNTNHLFSRWESINTVKYQIYIYWGNKLPGRQTLYLCLLGKQLTWQTDSLSLFIGETNYLADRLFISVYQRNKLPGRQTLYLCLLEKFLQFHFCFLLLSEKNQIPIDLFTPPSLGIVGFKHTQATFVKWDECHTS